MTVPDGQKFRNASHVFHTHAQHRLLDLDRARFPMKPSTYQILENRVIDGVNVKVADCWRMKNKMASKYSILCDICIDSKSASVTLFSKSYGAMNVKQRAALWKL